MRMSRGECFVPIYIQCINSFINQLLFPGYSPGHFPKLMTIYKSVIKSAITILNLSIILNIRIIVFLLIDVYFFKYSSKSNTFSFPNHFFTFAIAVSSSFDKNNTTKLSIALEHST